MKLSWQPALIGLKEKTATQPDTCSPDPTEPEEAEPADDALPEKGPQRRCLVLRESFTRETMLRFVLGPDNEIVFDVLATLPGRGMWLSASGNVIEQARKRGVFARAAKTQVRLPPDLKTRIEQQLRLRLIDLLGLARRSGNAVSGFEKAREWLTSGKAGLIVQAIDGSPEERVRFAGRSGLPIVTALDSSALGKVFGREHAVHAVIAAGKLARMIEVEAARLAGVAASQSSGQ